MIILPRYHAIDIYPLAVPKPYSTSKSELASKNKIIKLNESSKKSNLKSQKKPFLMQNYWGDYSPAYSVDSEVYGLKGANPLAPARCEITQVHYVSKYCLHIVLFFTFAVLID